MSSFLPLHLEKKSCIRDNGVFSRCLINGYADGNKVNPLQNFFIQILITIYVQNNRAIVILKLAMRLKIIVAIITVKEKELAWEKV